MNPDRLFMDVIKCGYFSTHQWWSILLCDLDAHSVDLLNNVVEQLGFQPDIQHAKLSQGLINGLAPSLSEGAELYFRSSLGSVQMLVWHSVRMAAINWKSPVLTGDEFLSIVFTSFFKVDTNRMK